jgi:hypothetical protein
MVRRRAIGRWDPRKLGIAFVRATIRRPDSANQLRTRAASQGRPLTGGPSLAHAVARLNRQIQGGAGQRHRVTRPGERTAC